MPYMPSTTESARATVALTGQGSGTFETAAKRALERLRGATKSTIESVGLGDVNSLALSRKLAIDKSLSWRMVRFVEEPNAFSASKHLPGVAGLRIFARAVSAAGATAASVAQFDAALEELEGVIAKHAGTRSARCSRIAPTRPKQTIEQLAFDAAPLKQTPRCGASKHTHD